jgi:predicted nucleotidyltransferase
MPTNIKYPTLEHEIAAEAIVDFFSKCSHVEAVILKGSCARGEATRDSCLDIAILMRPKDFSIKKDELENHWSKFYETTKVFKSLEQVGKYSQVDLDFIDGDFRPKFHGWTSGPDEFELEIGNNLVYMTPLSKHGNYLETLQAKWLPYYDEELRRQRLEMVYRYCKNNLEHIPLYVDRELYFQSFHRLYNAFGEFLQLLFISRRTYPIAYDKWIREQVDEILKIPTLYRKLTSLFEIKRFDSKELTQKAEDLTQILEIYVNLFN